MEKRKINCKETSNNFREKSQKNPQEILEKKIRVEKLIQKFRVEKAFQFPKNFEVEKVR